VVLIFGSEALVLKSETIAYKVINNNKKKKRMRKRTFLFIGKKGREFIFAYRTYLVGNEITLVKQG